MVQKENETNRYRNRRCYDLTTVAKLTKSIKIER